MIEEKIFSIQRFAHLMAFYWSQQKRNMLFLFLAAFAGLMLWYGINIMLQVRHIFNVHGQIIFYFIGLYLTGFLSGSMLFSELKHKPQAISYLLLPASALEKLICMMFFGVGGLYIGYSLTFTLVDSIMVMTANNMLNISEPIVNLLSLNSYEAELGDGGNTVYLTMYFAIQASFILGSVWFKNNALLKTIVVLVLAWATFVIVTWSLRQSIPAGIGRDDYLAYEVFGPAGESKLIELPYAIHFFDMIFLKVGVTLGLWIATYFRLKEKQII